MEEKVKLKLEDGALHIPETVTGTIYACLDVSTSSSFGNLKISDYNLAELYANQPSNRHITLAQMEVTVNLGEKFIDVRGELIKSIEDEMKNQMAEHHMKMQEFTEKLNQLRQLTYTPPAAQKEEEIL